MIKSARARGRSDRPVGPVTKQRIPTPQSPQPVPLSSRPRPVHMCVDCHNGLAAPGERWVRGSRDRRCVIKRLFPLGSGHATACHAWEGAHVRASGHRGRSGSAHAHVCLSPCSRVLSLDSHLAMFCRAVSLSLFCKEDARNGSAARSLAHSPVHSRLPCTRARHEVPAVRGPRHHQSL